LSVYGQSAPTPCNTGKSAAGCVAKERIKTDGRVVGAITVGGERTRTDGRVVVFAGGIANEGTRTGGRVAAAACEVASCVAIKRVKAAGRVIEAGRVAR